MWQDYVAELAESWKNLSCIVSVLHVLYGHFIMTTDSDSNITGNGKAWKIHYVYLSILDHNCSHFT